MDTHRHARERLLLVAFCAALGVVSLALAAAVGTLLIWQLHD